MNTLELSAYIGKTGLVTLEKLQVPCKILDARERFGRIDLLVCPQNGRGQQWVEKSRVREEK